MYKKALLCILTFPCIYAYSQERLITFHINPSVSWLSSSNSDVITKGSIIGYDAGIDIDDYFDLNEAWYWGASISNLGGQIENKSLNEMYNSELKEDNTSTLRVKSLNFPLGLKYIFKEIGYSNLYAQAGLIGQYSYGSSLSPSDKSIKSETVQKDTEKTNVGYQLGGGVEYAITRSTGLAIGLIYSSFFFSTFTNDNSVTNSSVSLRLGLRF